MPRMATSPLGPRALRNRVRSSSGDGAPSVATNETSRPLSAERRPARGSVALSSKSVAGSSDVGALTQRRLGKDLALAAQHPAKLVEVELVVASLINLEEAHSRLAQDVAQLITEAHGGYGRAGTCES